MSQTAGGQRFERGWTQSCKGAFLSDSVFYFNICNKFTTTGCSSPSTPGESGRAGGGLQAVRVLQLVSCASRLSLVSFPLTHLLVLEGKLVSPFLRLKTNNLIVACTRTRVHSENNTNNESEFQ